MNTSVLPKLLALYKINIIPVDFDMFDFFLPFAGCYFFIQDSFSIEFCTKNGFVQKCLKLSNQALNQKMENWIPEN